MRLTSVVLLLLAVIAACGEPLVMIPGGKLEGPNVPAPELWSLVPEVVQVETRPEDPYSVNIWSVGIAEHLYIATGDDGTRWSGYLDDDPQVRVRVGEHIHSLRAQRVADGMELAAVAVAYAEKYDVDNDDDWVSSGTVFRLDRTSP